MLYDTIAAISTAMAPAGIGIVRVSGEDSIPLVSGIFRPKGKKPLSAAGSHTLQYGHVVDPMSGRIIDEVLVSVMKGPNSFTAENVVEINSHGGILVLRKVLELVLGQGARLAEPGEFTKRAFLNGRIELSQAEAIMDVINAKTERALQLSVRQLEGRLGEKTARFKDILLSLIAHIEASIDYPEYDIEELAVETVMDRLEALKGDMQALVETFDQGRMLKEGINTAIVGKPNVGKSSLLNALLQEQRAIVTEIPGTTRDTLEEVVNIQGIPLRLVDTAGIRDTEDHVERIGIERSLGALQKADLVLFMVDGSRPLEEGDRAIVERIKDKKVIVLLNKMDLEVKASQKELRELLTDHPVVPVSAKNREGIGLLEHHIKEMFFHGEIENTEEQEVLLSNVRHKNAVVQAVGSLDHVMEAIRAGMPEDCWSIDLKNAYERIGEITGESIKEDLMGQIFSQFCLGK
ncbi:tRNA uridine-5-carboxymethylaminomethyl(34) synthesis GTPase MnmE [Anaerotalea alkaliphila]|uniref:tRNA modification GTPase MnmE n=1 Tax=Anaerotalea alkaliphila TaxID=2662126 RepID=A0A7X5HWQ4_9FIRM|nr:tRNA uridine-5-carboxymethylaminomethyl(34) synthesis GTPase MnmE [Anaerotalea alkaliphila]NDL68085.1 tRNA uridine-5-carboxymethylaminomethyl(34) synthesis GTPase MnmE [Anaerotalea alkaliphila]